MFHIYSVHQVALIFTTESNILHFLPFSASLPSYSHNKWVSLLRIDIGQWCVCVRVFVFSGIWYPVYKYRAVYKNLSTS